MRDRSQPAAHPQPAHAALSPAPIGGDAGPPRPASTMARLRAARGEQGLTTLEWLLIVAAVAGLAVVAVVIVTRVVNQTADQLASANPTVAAAQESARTLVEQAEAVAVGDRSAEWATDYKNRCNRLRTSFGTAVDVWTDAGHMGSPTGRALFMGHTTDYVAADWTNADTWIGGAIAEPAPVLTGSPRSGTVHSYFGCFIRQRPTN